MTFLIDPSYSYGDISATEVKAVLLMFTEHNAREFNAQRVGDPHVQGNDAWRFYLNFFIKHGLLVSLPDGGFNLTDLGIQLVMAQFRDPVERDVAKGEIENLKRRASWILDDPDHMSYIRGIFIFGSYVDSQKVKLGDLDVGISIGVKPEFKNLGEEQRIAQAKANYVRVVPEADRQEGVDFLVWERDYMLSRLVDSQPFTSIHMSTEVPTLRVQKVLWVYDSSKQLGSHALLDKTQVKMVNSYLAKTA